MTPTASPSPAGPPQVFATVLADLLRQDPGQPLLTFYDERSGERVELSRTTYANWVAKVASLLVDELDLERGARLRLDLPTHWLGPVFLGAAWLAGLVVTDDAEPDAVVCGPDTLDHWAPRAGDLPVLACALRPLGVRFPEGVPAGVHDVGVEVWSQPDAFAPWDPPTPQDPAVAWGGVVLTHEQLWQAATAGTLVAGGGRLISETNPASPPGLASWTEPLIHRGSLVLVVGAERDRVALLAESERATARFPA